MSVKSEVKEGEIICPKCNGSGNDKNNVYICEMCDGEGKVDWVSAAMVHEKRKSILQLISVRRLITNIKSTVEKYIHNNLYELKNFNRDMTSYLSTLKSRKMLDGYIINIEKAENLTDINIYLKPNRSVDTIKLNTIIMNI